MLPDITKMPPNLKLEQLKKDAIKAKANDISCPYCHRAMRIETANYWGICKECPKYPFNKKYPKKRDVVVVIPTRVPLWWAVCDKCKSKKLSIYQDKCMYHGDKK